MDVDQTNTEKIKRHSWATKLKIPVSFPDSGIFWRPFAFLGTPESFTKNDFDLNCSIYPMSTPSPIAISIREILEGLCLADLIPTFVGNQYLRPPPKSQTKILRSDGKSIIPVWSGYDLLLLLTLMVFILSKKGWQGKT